MPERSSGRDAGKITMATRRAKRIEPKFDDGERSPALDLRLDESDRATGSGGAKPRSRPKKKAANSNTSSKTKAPAARGTAAKKPASGRRGKGRRKSSRGGGNGGGGGITRFLRRSVYWTVVAGIWGTIAFVGLLGYYAAHLPPTSEWAVPQRPPNVKIVAADGSLLANRGDTGGESVRLEQLPPHLPEAVMAIEDRRFYYHFGIDPIGLARAIATNLYAGGLVQGGSTLTQQLAKNLFLEPERTFRRKMQEVVLSFWLEAKFSKEQILEMYLNRVYFGAGAYGVDAAARRYFGKSARKVTLAEAAILAGLLKAPSRYAPNRHPKRAEKRAHTVLIAMRDAGFITDREAKVAIATPTAVVSRHNSASENYVADWVMDQLPSFIGSLDEDIVVDTAIDVNLQHAAEESLRQTLSEDGKKYRVTQGAVVVLDASGAVKALVGGRDYGKSQFNRAIAAHRQPGSAFKPFVYLTALEQGMTPETIRVDEPVSIKGWRPKNYSKEYRGPVSLTRALSKSLNTVAARLAYEVGPKRVARTANRLGITSKLKANPSIALGTSEVTPLELTAAYVPFSNGGFGVVPHVIKRIRTASNKLLYERKGSGPGRVVSDADVGMMNHMLRETVLSGTGRKASLGDRPAGGKTGTSQDFRDAWFIGYTSYFTAGVWLGNDDNSPTRRATGGNLPAKIWARTMQTANEGLAVVDLPGSYRPAPEPMPEAVAMDGNDWGTDAPRRRPGMRQEIIPQKQRAPGLLEQLFGG